MSSAGADDPSTLAVGLVESAVQALLAPAALFERMAAARRVFRKNRREADMQLGKELAAGFVSDDAQATAAGEAGVPQDGTDAKAPEALPPPAPQPEPAAAG